MHDVYSTVYEYYLYLLVQVSIVRIIYYFSIYGYTTVIRTRAVLTRVRTVFQLLEYLK
jgi:hypothetical protein